MTAIIGKTIQIFRRDEHGKQGEFLAIVKALPDGNVDVIQDSSNGEISSIFGNPSNRNKIGTLLGLVNGMKYYVKVD